MFESSTCFKLYFLWQKIMTLLCLQSLRLSLEATSSSGRSWASLDRGKAGFTELAQYVCDPLVKAPKDHRFLQASVSHFRTPVVLFEGSRGQTSNRTSELCPRHFAATGEIPFGKIKAKKSIKKHRKLSSLLLLQGFIPLVVPDILKGVVFVSITSNASSMN